jgi:RNA-directed DNA polymerase
MLISAIIAEINPVLRGWGQYFRTGNAADKFTQVDRYVVDRLRRLRRQRAGSRLRAGQVDAWDRPFFEALGLYRLRGTIQYPEAA